jgi:Flp pilus assembly protein TadD
MDAGDWTQAWPILQKCRLDNPSSAEVMADLGWTAWHVRGRSGDAGESAEDYLRLALTFEPRHLRALEYLARIGLRRGEPEVARKRLQQYLSVQPDAAWARRALAALDEPENTVNSPGSKLRLRKG